MAFGSVQSVSWGDEDAEFRWMCPLDRGVNYIDQKLELS